MVQSDHIKFGLLLTLGTFVPVGSRVTCNPAPTDTDEDWLVLTTDMRRFRDVVFGAGYKLSGSEVRDASVPLDSSDRFSSYMLVDVNLIVTQDPIFFGKFLAATNVAKRFNLLEKRDRITLFQCALYDAEVQNEPV
jgi:hypothetical protein